MIKRTIYTLLCLTCTGFLAFSQDLDYFGTSARHQKSFQLSAGTQGVGADFNYGLIQWLAVRLGANFAPLTLGDAFPIPGVPSRSTLDADFANIHLLADFTPFKHASFLRVIAGAAYFIHASGNFEMLPTGVYNYGDITLTSAETGKVDLDANWKGVAPYAGIGLVKVFPLRSFNVNLDLGTYYLSSPITSVVGTGVLDGNSSQNAQFQKNMGDYRFLPVVQLNFAIKL